MKEKLVRNTSNAQSKAWWDAVREIAANAPKLNLQGGSKKPESSSEATLERPRPGKKR